MRLNIFSGRKRRPPLAGPRTHEGAPAISLSNEQILRRSLFSCFLWEDGFYEDGVEIAERIETTADLVPPERGAALAIEAREVMHLRHAPLLLLLSLIKRAPADGLAAATVARAIQRPDEMTELLALYWRGGKRPLAKQLKLGLAQAFIKFDGYQLAKYNRPAPIRLRDVLFLSHAKPKDEAQAALWKQLADNRLPAPDTWEVQLSAGADKKATFERLLTERRLGYLALLRNLRGMAAAEVDEDLIVDAILARRGAERVLPFRYVAAARAAPRFETALDQALQEAILAMPVLPGRTIVLVDVSASMGGRLSRRSDMNRLDAAAALAAILPGKLRVFTFSNEVVEVPARRGMAGVDAVIQSQAHGGTRLGHAVEAMNRLRHDRLIVLTDEQSHDRVPAPVAKLAYMINVATYRHGVGHGDWTRIDGFSEGVFRYIQAHEAAMAAR